ncbi:MAG: hypothetical protein AAF677_05290 [Pseudomonadota bacterium]
MTGRSAMGAALTALCAVLLLGGPASAVDGAMRAPPSVLPDASDASARAEAAYLSALGARPANDGLRALGHLSYGRIATLRLLALACDTAADPAAFDRAAETLRLAQARSLQDASSAIRAMDAQTLGRDWALGQVERLGSEAAALADLVAATRAPEPAEGRFHELHAAATWHLADLEMVAQQISGLTLPVESRTVPEFIAAAIAFEMQIAIDQPSVLACAADAAQAPKM